MSNHKCDVDTHGLRPGATCTSGAACDVATCCARKTCQDTDGDGVEHDNFAQCAAKTHGLIKAKTECLATGCAEATW